MAEHVAHVRRLEAAGEVSHAGPFHRGDARVVGELVGLVMFTSGAGAAAAHVAADPAVRAGVMTAEVRPWYA